MASWERKLYGCISTTHKTSGINPLNRQNQSREVLLWCAALHLAKTKNRISTPHSNHQARCWSRDHFWSQKTQSDTNSSVNVGTSVHRLKLELIHTTGQSTNVQEYMSEEEKNHGAMKTDSFWLLFNKLCHSLTFYILFIWGCIYLIYRLDFL